MSDDAIPMASPRCSACDVLLTADGGRRSCPRCGREFIVALIHAGHGAAYRAAPAFDLASAHDPPPRGSGLRVHQDGDVLDLTIGDRGLLSSAWMTASLVAILVAFFALIPLELWLPLNWIQTFIALGVLFACVWRVTRPLRSDTLDVAVREQHLVWRRFDGNGVLRGEWTQELASITGVHDAGRHIRLTTESGPAVEIGKGLNAPPRVIRWVVQRLAEHLPVPDHGDDDGPQAEHAS